MTGFLLELKALAMSDQAIVVSEKNGEAVAALLDLSRRTVASTARVDMRGSSSQWSSDLVDALYAGLDRNAPARPTVPMETGVSVSDDGPDWLFGRCQCGSSYRDHRAHPPLARWRRWDSDSVWNGRSFDSFLV